MRETEHPLFFFQPPSPLILKTAHPSLEKSDFSVNLHNKVKIN